MTSAQGGEGLTQGLTQILTKAEKGKGAKQIRQYMYLNPLLFQHNSFILTLTKIDIMLPNLKQIYLFLSFTTNAQKGERGQKMQMSYVLYGPKNIDDPVQSGEIGVKGC